MPGDFNVSIDLASILAYAEDRFLSLFGRDSWTTERRNWFQRLTEAAAHRAKYVMCVGMDRPIPIQEVYQPTRLRSRTTGLISAKTLRDEQFDAVIVAGPGRGKTTFLHWLLISLLERKSRIPVLFSLRVPGALEDLEYFVGFVKNTKFIKGSARGPLLLMLDGYDEVAAVDRRRVSRALTEFAAAEVGHFYLTCRLYYELYDISAPVLDLESFNKDDAENYIRALASTYKTEIDAAKLLRELEERGFQDFTESPLLLTLVCILKTGPMPSLPQNAVGLIRRALDTLTFRWDYAKSIYRDSTLALDGEERVRCMMRVAYHMLQWQAREEDVLTIVRDHLALMQRSEIDATKLLVEMAQWYGLLVPVEELRWTFVHRTIHDFLAARFWVEGGRFSPRGVVEWNARAAYAACLSTEATEALCQALRKQEDVFAVSEILANHAAFEVEPVAEAVLDHYRRFERFDKAPGSYSRGVFIYGLNPVLELATQQDIFPLMPNELLLSLLKMGSGLERELYTDLVVGYALAELIERGIDIPRDSAELLQNRYNGQEVTFYVMRRRGLQEISLRRSLGEFKNDKAAPHGS